jgi:hypothetical protein
LFVEQIIQRIALSLKIPAVKSRRDWNPAML